MAYRRHDIAFAFTKRDDNCDTRQHVSLKPLQGIERKDAPTGRDAMRFYVLYTQGGVIISKDNYLPKRQLLEEIEGCVAFIGPLPVKRAAAYLAECYPDLWPVAEVQLARLQASVEPYGALTFQLVNHTPQRS
jgi:hypothetical protein